ncbi:hypothetical protein HK105_203029 [Polyrhizophydium stewartii]|uniref:Uncharacterized protein n=1 Tax=Polyrhizophydium stewartii TaxID=2732419 RepID=A0ABR4NCV8_9FUNG|nr:hypothetical protein HK105_008040 [Polyrhizophydium stewartii]
MASHPQRAAPADRPPGASAELKELLDKWGTLRLSVLAATTDAFRRMPSQAGIPATIPPELRACAPDRLGQLRPVPGAMADWGAVCAAAERLFNPALTSASQDDQLRAVSHYAAFLNFTANCIHLATKVFLLNPATAAVAHSDLLVLLRSLSGLIATPFRSLAPLVFESLPGTSPSADPHMAPPSSILPYKSWVSTLSAFWAEYGHVLLPFMRYSEPSMSAIMSGPTSPTLVTLMFCMTNYFLRYIYVIPGKQDFIPEVEAIEKEIVERLFPMPPLPARLMLFPALLLGASISRIFSVGDGPVMNLHATINLTFYGAQFISMSIKRDIPSAASIIKGLQARLPIASTEDIARWRALLMAYNPLSKSFGAQKLDSACLARDMMLVDLVFSENTSVELVHTPGSALSCVFVKQTSAAPGVPYFESIMPKIFVSGRNVCESLLARIASNAALFREAFTFASRPKAHPSNLKRLLELSVRPQSPADHSVSSPFASIVSILVDAPSRFKTQPARITDIMQCLEKELGAVITSHTDAVSLFGSLPQRVWSRLRDQHAAQRDSPASSTIMMLYAACHRILSALEQNYLNRLASGQEPTSQTALAGGFNWRVFFAASSIPALWVHAFLVLHKAGTADVRDAKLLLLEAIEAQLRAKLDVDRRAAEQAVAEMSAGLLAGDEKLLAGFPSDLSLRKSPLDLTLAYVDMGDIALSAGLLLMRFNHTLRKAVIEQAAPVAGDDDDLEVGEIDDIPEIEEHTTLGILLDASLGNAPSLKRPAPDGGSDTRTHGMQQSANKLAKTITVASAFAVSGVFDTPPALLDRRRERLDEIMQKWSALVCTLDAHLIRADLAALVSACYPSDTKRMLDYALSDLMSAHAWILGDVVDMLPLDTGAEKTGQRPAKSTAYNHRQAPFYAILTVLRDSSRGDGSSAASSQPPPNRSQVTDPRRRQIGRLIKKGQSPAILQQPHDRAAADVARSIALSQPAEQPDNSTAMMFLGTLAKRLLRPEQYQSVALDAAFGKNNTLFAFFVDAVNACPVQTASDLLRRLFSSFERSASETDPGVVAARRLFLAFVTGLASMGHKSDSPLRSIVFKTALFGRTDVVDFEKPVPMTQLALQMPKAFLNVLRTFLCLPENSSEIERSASEQTMIAILLCPVGPEQPQGTKIVDMFFALMMKTRSDVGMDRFRSNWIWPMAETLVEYADLPNTLGLALFRLLVRSKVDVLAFARPETRESGTFVQGQAAAGLPVPVVGSSRTTISDLLNAFSDFEQHPNLPQLLAAWKRYSADSHPDEILFLAGHLTSKLAGPVQAFLAGIVSRLVEKSPDKLEVLLRMALVSDHTDSIMQALRPQLCKVAAGSSPSRQAVHAMESWILDIYAMHADDFEYSATMQTVPTPSRHAWPGRLEAAVAVLSSLQEWDAAVFFDCMASPVIGDTLLCLVGQLSVKLASPIFAMLRGLFTDLASPKHRTSPVCAAIEQIYDSLWRRHGVRLFGRMADPALAAEIIPALEALLSLSASAGRVGVASAMAQLAASHVSKGIRHTQPQLVEACVSVLLKLLGGWPDAGVCESIHGVLVTHVGMTGLSASIVASVSTGGQDATISADLEMRHELLRLLTPLLKTTKRAVDPVLLVGSLNLLSVRTDSFERQKALKMRLLDIVEACCQLRVHRGELTCGLVHIVFALAGGETATYERAVGVLRKFRRWIALAQDDAKPPTTAARSAIVKAAAQIVERNVELSLRVFDAKTSLLIQDLMKASQLPGEKAVLRQAQGDIGLGAPCGEPSE